MSRLKFYLILAGIALAALWRLLSAGKGRGQVRAEDLQQRLSDALRARAAEEQARKEAEANAELDKKRAGSAADRLRGALGRARRRRGG